MSKPVIPLIDSHAAFVHGSKMVDSAVRAGKLDREQAFKILKESRENYRTEKFNRQAEKVNAGLRQRSKR